MGSNPLSSAANPCGVHHSLPQPRLFMKTKTKKHLGIAQLDMLSLSASGFSRSKSMPNFQTSRPGYNRVIGQALHKSSSALEIEEKDLNKNLRESEKRSQEIEIFDQLLRNIQSDSQRENNTPHRV